MRSAATVAHEWAIMLEAALVAYHRRARHTKADTYPMTKALHCRNTAYAYLAEMQDALAPAVPTDVLRHWLQDEARAANQAMDDLALYSGIRLTTRGEELETAIRQYRKGHTA